MLTTNKKINPELYHFLSMLKQCVAKKQSKLIFRKRSKFTPLLSFLVNIGLIKSFYEYSNLIIVWPKVYINSHKITSFVELSNFKRIKRKATTSLANLVKLQRREGGAAYYIISTDKGIMTSFDAIKLNLGGLILFRVA